MFTILIKMPSGMAGAEQQYAPRPVGEILHGILKNSDSPLAKGYRKFLASKENGAEKGGEA